MTTKKTKLTYSDSGVDIDEANQLIDNIKPIVGQTLNKNVLSNIGGFGALYELDIKQYKKPVLSICVGLQHINVIYGGTLYEDLKTLNPSSVDHGKFNGGVSYHNVSLNPDSYIFSVIGKKTFRLPALIIRGYKGWEKD